MHTHMYMCHMYLDGITCMMSETFLQGEQEHKKPLHSMSTSEQLCKHVCVYLCIYVCMRVCMYICFICRSTTNRYILCPAASSFANMYVRTYVCKHVLCVYVCIFYVCYMQEIRNHYIL